MLKVIRCVVFQHRIFSFFFQRDIFFFWKVGEKKKNLTLLRHQMQRNSYNI